MIAVIFEVEPHPAHRDDYFRIANELRPLLDQIDGFISIERFQSLRDETRILSLSFWRDEEAIMQWRVAGKWHRLQIARQADQHGPAGFCINTCHGHAVWPESNAIPPGVAAHQQDVVAPVLGDLVAAATEDSRRQVMLRRDHRGDSDEAPEDRERHSKAEH